MTSVNYEDPTTIITGRAAVTICLGIPIYS